MRLSVLLLLLLSVAVTQARRILRPNKMPAIQPRPILPKPVPSGSKGAIQVHRKLETPRTNPIKPRPPPKNAEWLKTKSIPSIPSRHTVPITADKEMKNLNKKTHSTISLKSNIQANINLGETGTRNQNPVKSFTPLKFTALLMKAREGIDRAFSSRDSLPIAEDKKPNNGTKWTDPDPLKPLRSKEIIQGHENLENTGMNPVTPYSPLNFTALLMVSDTTDRAISSTDSLPITADKKPNNGV